VPPAPSLAQVVRAPYRPSHGNPPDRLPAAPYGLSDLGAAAALRVIGPEREAWMQGMQSADVSAVPMGGGVAALVLGGKGTVLASRGGRAWLGKRAGRATDAGGRRPRSADLLHQGLLRGTGSGGHGHLPRPCGVEPGPPPGPGPRACAGHAPRSVQVGPGKAR